MAGVTNFLRLAETAGWRTIFLGPAVSVQEMIAAAQREGADLVGVSYRLTPETAEDVIEASKIAHRAIENAVRGAPDMTTDPALTQRRKQLVKEAGLLLEAIASCAGPEVGDPFIDAATLARVVTCGLLDAPQLRNNKFGRGEIRTRIIHGANVSVDKRGKVIQEQKRLTRLV